MFGRERFDEHRDDRGGVGSMRSDSKTLYIGRMHPSSATNTVIEKHFRPWGELEQVKVLKDKGVGFVTYQNRLNAEFAKEAMANQSLDHGEVTYLCMPTCTFFISSYSLRQVPLHSDDLSLLFSFVRL